MRATAAALLLAGCATTRSTDPSDLAGDWILAAPPGASVSLQINGDATRISGQAPCNSYFAPIIGPGFRVGPIGASRRACAELEVEQRYLTRLATVTSACRSGTVLTLSNSAGPVLTFKRAD